MALRSRPVRRNARIDAHVLEALWAEEAARRNPYDGLDAVDDFLDFSEGVEAIEDAVDEERVRRNPAGDALSELMGLVARAMQRHKVEGAIDVDFGTKAQCSKSVDTRPEQWAPFCHWLWVGTKKGGLVTSSEHPTATKQRVTCWYEPKNKNFRCVKSEWEAATSKLKQSTVNDAVAEVAKYMREIDSQTVEFTKEQQQTYKPRKKAAARAPGGRAPGGRAPGGRDTKQSIIKELAVLLASVGESDYDGAMAEAKDAYNRAVAIQGKPPDKEFVRQVKLLYDNIISNLPPEHRGKASWDEVREEIVARGNKRALESALDKKLETLRTAYALLHPGELAKWANVVIAENSTSSEKMPVHVYVDAKYLGPNGKPKEGRLLVGQAQALEGKQFKQQMLKIPGVKSVHVSLVKPSTNLKFIVEV